LYNYQNYGPASCAGLPYPGVPATGQNEPHPGVSAATVKANEAALRTPAYGDIGPVGSAYENELVSAVAAPLLRVAPRDVPSLADLLLGPLMRGTAVTLG
jgi:hypothetical protein